MYIAAQKPTTKHQLNDSMIDDLFKDKLLAGDLRFVPACVHYWRDGLVARDGDDALALFLNDHFQRIFMLGSGDVQSWLSDIPSAVLGKARPLPHLYFTLMYAASSPFAVQLLLDCPVLFLLLVSKAQKAHCSVDTFVCNMALKRVDLLSLALGIATPVDKSALKFLAKLSYNVLTLKDLNAIGDFIINGSFMSLAHLSVIPVNLISLMTAQPDVIAFKILPQIKKQWQVTWLSGCVHQAIHDADDLHFTVSGLSFLADAKDVNAMTKVMRVFTWLSDVKASVKGKAHFPYAPIKGCDASKIYPITKGFDLFAWGLNQHNCVYDYFDQIMSGDYFMYKMLGKKSVTIGVSLSDGKPVLDDVLYKRNAPVPKDVMAVVKNWFLTAPRSPTIKHVCFNRYALSYVQTLDALMAFHANDGAIIKNPTVV